MVNRIGKKKRKPISNKDEDISKDFSKKYPLEILIVEDDPVNQLVITGMLKRLGYLPKVAANGIDCLIWMQKAHFSLIFMDQNMPSLDGIDTTREIRLKENPHATKVRIVAITSSASEVDQKKYFSSGMDGFIEKPINKTKLLNELKAAYLQSTKQPILLAKLTHNNESIFRAQDDLQISYLVENVDIIRKNINTSLDQISKSIKEKNGKSLEMAAHKLRGSLSYFKNESILELLLQIEELGKANDTAKAEIIFHRNKKIIKGFLPKILKEIKAWKKTA